MAMEHPEQAARQWLMCPALDADPSWHRSEGAAMAAASVRRTLSAQLLRGAPRPLLQQPLPMPWVRWAMQPREAIAQRLRVLTGVLLQPVVRRCIAAAPRQALVGALGDAGYHEAVSHPLDAALAAPLAALCIGEPDWSDDGASLAPGLALARAQLAGTAPGLAWRLRLKFTAALAARCDAWAADAAWQAPALGPLVDQVLREGAP